MRPQSQHPWALPATLRATTATVAGSAANPNYYQEGERDNRKCGLAQRGRLRRVALRHRAWMAPVSRPEPSTVPSANSERASTSANLLTYLSVLARRKWVMLPAIIITPLVAVALNMQKPAVYEATAQVFLNRLNLAASLSGVVAPES